MTTTKLQRKISSRSVSIPIIFTLLSLYPAASTSQSTSIDVGNIRCFSLQKNDTPDPLEGIPPHRAEVWCYQSLESPVGAMFIFNADQSEVRPELSLIKEQNGTLTHGTLLQGQITYSKIDSNLFNPFGIPLDPPDGAEPISSKSFLFPSAHAIKERLLVVSDRNVASVRLVRGTRSARASSSIQPWRGYWWSYKGGAMARSPMQKYDRYLRVRAGVSGGASNWEKQWHEKTVSWQGHCNGWAASSILRPEPKVKRYDPRSKVTFLISDQKGLLAEVDSCASFAFFGRRYNDSGTSSKKDIHPDLFHKTLVYYIGGLRKPIAMDYDADVSVFNHVITGYQMSIREESATQVVVTAKLTVHKYDHKRYEQTGKAPIYHRTYKYRLRRNLSGEILSGTWLSGNPDFLWVPLSPSQCVFNNPRIEPGVVQQIIDGRF